MAKNYDLFLQGPVGGWDFDSSYVDYILDKFNDREVTVLIDSLGGRTDTALSICAAFVNHGNVTVHFKGMNASAATIASMGAKKITIEDSALYLVHKCSLEFFDWSMKNADQLQSYIEQLQAHKEDLDKIDSHIAELYARKCKKSSSDLLALMKKGGWLTPSEAKDWGFVDEIVTGKEKKPIKISSLEASYFSDAGIPIPPGCAVEDADSSSGMNKFFERLSNLFNSHKMENNSKSSDEQKASDAIQNSNEQKKGDSKNSELDALRSEYEEYKRTQSEEIAKLKAENEELKKKPAADTSSVVEDSKSGSKNEEPSAVQAFVETTASAKKLFDSLP